ncbi:MAG: hypothetical protein UW46_C0007G0029 [Candidatus Yanofskybacteria bacterium GW2011_GWF1_44_227]|uniref:Uncharacterized protein n=1 Tax=Candidatus Yanofskybacteria bacterium GW2011_GWE2_40_11 TaxID=1619033 RepID=A0A0G0SYT8_9BACT|nr:MAG: hypothetical protein UT69_C0014G0009 [Candidatus Yanofskybacteria bacterium GW2011_GWE1_40_10]KKR40000.1 MAG: hypothetical protein UT75_C0011G0028 [Candidatus Yanofskybacteria bacterium GW2011_GWE2_40_11]KKT15369.1 MAG: hypothetical protein UV97_C0008G0018 [Candidatus Yanofskybacteria bacterium GW2011_GWF2_43_596]KKT53053.1 MAG: hypothetical protein UW46_C0007G0029 [Candidatus Yanofskybacteria bacterium GW2011_GWF1_44_227]OGN35735.1 MAG: hypothetical protein A2241_02520 [Candidatus Yano
MAKSRVGLAPPGGPELLQRQVPAIRTLAQLEMMFGIRLVSPAGSRQVGKLHDADHQDPPAMPFGVWPDDGSN